MRTIKNISSILIIALTLITFSCKAQLVNQAQIQQNLTTLSSQIIGTWESEDDPNWTIQFMSNGTCYWYYTNEDTDVFTYVILTTSPQCGQQVKTGGLEDFYLRLVDQSDNDEYCYEILGVDNESLSLSTVGLGVKYYYFNKQ